MSTRVYRQALTAVAFCLWATLGHGRDVEAVSSSGGAYFSQRLELPVPVFFQDDPKWTNVLLGPTTDTLGEEGCTLTSIVMVLNFYGVRTDPPGLNRYLSTHAGYDDEGLLDFDQIGTFTSGRIRLVAAGVASHRLLDQDLLAGHPVIVQLTLPDGGMHFVVVAGKDGWEYLVRDPAGDPGDPMVSLRSISAAIDRQYLFLKQD